MRDPKTLFDRPIAWLWLFLIWSLPALPVELSLWLLGIREPPFFGLEGQLLTANLFTLLCWWAWVPITPMILRLSWRFPVVAPVNAPGSTRWKHLAIHFALGVAVSLYIIFFKTALAIPFFGDRGLDLMIFRILRDFKGELVLLWVIDLWRWLGVYALVAVTAHGWRFYEEARERQIALGEARLATLKAQIHPHFLFNTLNSISTLMADDVPTARRTLAQLSQMLRSSLAEPAGEKVSLEEEINLVRLYLGIEQVRFGDRLEIEIEIEPEAGEAAIPHLLLQPLVENAVRHGIARRTNASLISVVAERDGANLHIRIDDDGPGPDSAVPAAAVEATGIGLANTRSRLQQLYGEQAHVELRERPGGGGRCLVSLPWESAADLMEARS